MAPVNLGLRPGREEKRRRKEGVLLASSSSSLFRRDSLFLPPNVECQVAIDFPLPSPLFLAACLRCRLHTHVGGWCEKKWARSSISAAACPMSRHKKNAGRRNLGKGNLQIFQWESSSSKQASLMTFFSRERAEDRGSSWVIKPRRRRRQNGAGSGYLLLLLPFSLGGATRQIIRVRKRGREGSEKPSGN